MNHIHKNTENDKKPKPTLTLRTPSLDDQKPSLDDQKPSLGDKKPINKRKKTTRSGNAFIRPPKQNLLIMRHHVILRFD